MEELEQESIWEAFERILDKYPEAQEEFKKTRVPRKKIEEELKSSASTTRTERGWAGHLVGANRCKFRRNTLLENGDVRIVVSSVGHMYDPSGSVQIGLDWCYETMVFHAEWEKLYWDADTGRQISTRNPWTLKESEFGSDQKANDMHEVIVAEITEALDAGFTFGNKK